MAKLSAYGQREVVRVAKTFPADDAGLIRTVNFAIMSNGRILRREAVRWPDGMRKDYGWKVLAWRAGAVMTRVLAWTERKEAQGWTVVRGPAWALAEKGEL